MDFYEMVDQVVALLQARGRVTYRALKVQFTLDDDRLDALKEELLYSQPQVIDDNGRGLVWTGDTETTPEPSLAPIHSAPPSGTQAVLSPPVASAPITSQMPEAERRQLTVLFCDLADSTRLGRQLDPEDLREVIRAYQATCVTVIQRFAGYVAQYLGDGLLVYFGYPQAHEDDAQRAVRTGLGILESMGTLNTRLVQDQGVRLAVRIGIHTGLVVVGEMGSGGRHEHLALGDTPNLAARLQGLAAPDTVVLSDATSRLVQGYFTYQDLGTHELKGIDTPVRVYRVVGESTAQSRLDIAGPSGLTPLVGREAEMSLLRERWAQSTEGRGQVVLLSGEAGIGKSRLVHGLTTHVVDAGTPRLTFRCSPYHINSALYPIIEHLQRLVQWHRDAPPEATLAALERVLQTARLPLAEAVPLVAALLSLQVPARYAPLTLSSQRQKQKTLEVLVAWLLAETTPQPVLAVWEDLHWADPSILELLGLVLDQVPTTHLLLVLTCRPEFRPPWPLRSYMTQLTLTHLTHQQVEEMVLRVTGSKPLPAKVMQQIVVKTDGVPLFVEELVKAILDMELMREEAGRYVLPGPLPPLAIPATLHDALMARLDRLAAAKQVAQLGATIGRTFAYDLVQAVASLDETTLQGALAQLVEAELVAQRGMPPQATYTFKHALIQDAAYQSLLRSTRQQYHQRIGQVMAERFPETAETQPEVVAQHYTAAGIHAQALPYWQRAGQRALKRSAYREAVASLERGLEAVSHLPQNRAALEQAIDLRFALRSALHPLGDLGRILANLHEAEALAAALDDPRRLARVSIFLSVHFSFIGAYDEAVAAGQRALVLATSGGDVVLHALANQYLNAPYIAQGDYCRAIDCLGQAVAVFDGARRHERFGQANLPAVLSRSRLAWCHAELGTFAEGRALGEEGLWIAEAVDHPVDLVSACWGIGLLFLRQGDLPRAFPLLERAVSICRDADLPSYFPLITAAMGAAYTLGGRVADAMPLLTHALEQTTVAGRLDLQALCCLSMGEAHLLAGRLEEAHTLTAQALALTRQRQERGNEAYALRLLGDIAARREPPDSAQAEIYYQHALALAGELGMRPLQAHCHYGLGTVYRQTGRDDLARAALSTAIDLYRVMDMTFWLPQAEATLSQVEEL